MVSDSGPKEEGTGATATLEQPEAANLDTSQTPTNNVADNVLLGDFGMTSEPEASPEVAPEQVTDLSLADMSTSFGASLRDAQVNSYQDLRAFAAKTDNDLELNAEQLEFLQDLMEPVNTGVYEGIHQSLEARLASTPESERDAAKAFAYDTMHLVVSKVVSDSASLASKQSLDAVAPRIELAAGPDSSDIRILPRTNSLYWDARHPRSAQDLGMAA